MDAASTLALGFGALIDLIAFSAMVLCAAVPALGNAEPTIMTDDEIEALWVEHDGEHN